MDNQAQELPSVGKILAATKNHSARDQSRILVTCELTDGLACPRLTQRKVALELAGQLHRETRAEVNVLLGAKARYEELQSYITSTLWHEFESLMVYRVRPYEDPPTKLVDDCIPQCFPAGPLNIDLFIIPRTTVLVANSATSENHQVAIRT